VNWNLSPIEFIGLAGTALTITTYLMRTMIRLRTVALLGSAAFAAYGLLSGSFTVVVTELLLFPINALRLFQVKKLIGQVEKASLGDFSLDWLKPLGKPSAWKEGESVFLKGDPATCLYFIAEGRFRLPESGIVLGPGEIVGEIGLVSAGNVRTQSLEAMERGTLLAVDYSDVQQLHFQSPEFGFYFLKLISGRLLSNLATAEARADDLEARLERAQGAGKALAPEI
jgi:CRP/FNR family cyclic AMP-dependent transcriptional regulator